VVQVHEFAEIDGELLMALELVDGVDALALLRSCSRAGMRLPQPLALFIIAEVLDALEYAHTAVSIDGKPLEVVHRDISPSNIFIARRGYVKLGDFGIARVVEEQRAVKTQGATLKGKYGYMAPEQVVGAPLDARADIFGVGIVLAEMLMGRRLFTAPNDLDVLLMVRDANLERLHRHGGDIPTELRQIIDTALARSREARYATAGAFRDAVHDYLFRNHYRVGDSELARFLETVPPSSRAPSHAADETGVEGGLDGPQTNAAREKAAAMRSNLRAAAREMEVVIEAMPEVPSIPSADVATGKHEREPTPVEVARAIEKLGAVSAPGPLPVGPLPPQPHPGAAADSSGDLSATSPARIFSALAAELETGLLVVESDDVVKEIFMARGIPEFVTSNAPNERLGEYLVAHDVITEGELAMTLAILPRFNGKLGDTLVGLGLMRPLEVFRHLSRQVRDKLIDVFGWQRGKYRYFRGRTNEKDAFPLRLDPWEILGAAVANLTLEPLRDRLLVVAEKKARRVERVRPTPEDFRLGAGPRELWSRVDGRRTVGEWLRRYEEPEQHLTLCRTLYLLIETELVAFD
jgi:serine/threonine-protein kinase